MTYYVPTGGHPPQTDLTTGDTLQAISEDEDAAASIGIGVAELPVSWPIIAASALGPADSLLVELYEHWLEPAPGEEC